MSGTKDKFQPQGIPAVTYVRIQNPDQVTTGAADILSDDASVTILEPNKPSSRHDSVAFVLPRGITDQEACESTIGQDAGAGDGGGGLNPISAFVNDSASAVIFLLGSKNTRKSLFLKRTFLPFLANELFANIEDKKKMAFGLYETRVNASGFEIQDEIITDLLRPSSRGLTVSITAEEGVKVLGLHHEVPNDEMSLRKVMDDCCENRVTHTQPPGGSIETSTAVFEFELYQTEEIQGASVKKSVSKLVIVDVPCVNALISGSDLRQLEGPTLHKSLSCFVDVCRKLTSPGRAAIAPFRSSKLTSYLAELLGGNALVLAIGTVAQGEPLASRKTMELLDVLSRSVHFPIGGLELTEMVQGLLVKYRSMVLQLQDELENGAPIGEKAAEVSEKTIRDMQQEMAKALNERNIAKDDCARLYEMMELLKTKYQTLTDQKNEQAEELIKSEEEKLTIARALVELKLEHSQLREGIEKERFELTSHMMASKEQVKALQDKNEASEKELTVTKDNLDSEKNKLISEQQEIAALKATLQEVRDTLNRERSKSLDLGAELLTLVNQKESLQTKSVELQRNLDNLALTSESQAVELKEQHVITEELRKALQVKEHEFLDLRTDKTDIENDLKNVELELRHAKEDAERALNDFQREKENTYQNARKAAETDIQKALKDLEEAQISTRRLEKRLRDKDREFIRSQTDLEQLTNEKKLVDEELDNVRNNYRAKLHALSSEDGGDRLASLAEALKDGVFESNSRPNSRTARPPSNPKLDVGNRPQPGSSGTDGPVVGGNTLGKTDELAVAAKGDPVVEQLLKSYVEKEEHLNKALGDAQVDCFSFKTAYRRLFDKYQEALDILEESLPEKFPDEKDIIHEQNLITQASKDTQAAILAAGAVGGAGGAAATVLAEKDEVVQEREHWQSRLRAAEAELIAEQERTAVTISSMKERVDATEAKKVLLSAEVKSLREQVKNLVQSAVDMPKKSAQDVAVGAKYASEMAQMQEDNEQLRQSLALANAQIRSQAAVSKSIDGAINSPTKDGNVNGENIPTAEGRNQIATFMEHLKSAEMRNVELVTRNAQLEEELQSYQKYMKDTVLLYRRQIQVLKTQLNSLVNGTDGSNGNAAIAMGNEENNKPSQVTNLPKL